MAERRPAGLALFYSHAADGTADVSDIPFAKMRTLELAVLPYWLKVCFF